MVDKHGPSGADAQEDRQAEVEEVVAEAATSDVPPDEPATGDVGPDEGVAEPEEADASSIEHDLDELLSKAKERDEYLSLAQRTQADFENYRKRVARDVGAAEQRGVGKLAKELLPALDSLEIALSHLPEDSVKGVELVQQELLGALGRVGIEVFSPEGEPFDPNEHEAMAKRAVEGVDAGLVAEVYQRGYRVNGSILRPARVVVAE
jgi:molecular chaperone GrpE